MAGKEWRGTACHGEAWRGRQGWVWKGLGGNGMAGWAGQGSDWQGTAGSARAGWVGQGLAGKDFIMSRQLRRVRPGWEHPKFTAINAPFFKAIGKYIPLKYGHGQYAADTWDLKAAKWSEGLMRDHAAGRGQFKPKDPECEGSTAEEWYGPRPDPDAYMSPPAEGEEAHFVLYETTSEGTPKTPAFPTIDLLLDYIVENKITYFADYTCSREEWAKILEVGGSIGVEITVSPDGSMSDPRPA